MSATRLLVLGVMRFMQPVHGYDLRRELLSWRIGERTNVKPGSIYGALRTLEKDGCIAVQSRESEDSRPERTSYVVTKEGEKEFSVLLRQSWWTVTPTIEPLVPALCLMPFLPREELIAVLSARISQLEVSQASLSYNRGLIRDGATGADGEVPDHVREIIDFVTAKSEAEIAWTRTLQHRLRDGAYTFLGEAGLPGPLPKEVVES